MDFVLNGRSHSLDAELVRARVVGVPLTAIRKHWVEIDGRRMPPKQVFRVVTGLHDEPFTSHFALCIFTGGPSHRGSGQPPLAQQRRCPGCVPPARRLSGGQRADRDTGRPRVEAGWRRPSHAAGIAVASGFDEDLVDSALVVRERVGMLDALIHAAVITQVLPLILDEGETVLKRPSLGAGNDPDRVYDLETTHRVAEFKLSSWKGSDGMRQRGLFADVVGLSLDTTARRRQVFVVGELPARFLTTSKRNAARTLSKAAIRLRTPPGLSDKMTVAEFTKAATIEVVDLTAMLSGLR